MTTKKVIQILNITEYDIHTGLRNLCTDYEKISLEDSRSFSLEIVFFYIRYRVFSTIFSTVEDTHCLIIIITSHTYDTQNNYLILVLGDKKSDIFSRIPNVK